MAPPTVTEDLLPRLRSADRLARAVSLWLRREFPPGAVPSGVGPEHRDLLAGLVAGLGGWLGLEAGVLQLAAYSLALLEREGQEAVDTPTRLIPSSQMSPAYRHGLRIATRVIGALRDDAARRAL